MCSLSAFLNALLCNAPEHSILYGSVLTDDANFLFDKIHSCVTRAFFVKELCHFPFKVEQVLVASPFTALVNDFLIFAKNEQQTFADD